MGKLRWGIIGIGEIVKGTMAPAMIADPDCELVAAVSRDQSRADAFAARFGARYAYTSYDEMLANPEVDAVFIATPNAQHAVQVVAAARAGKHVLCDKPVATSVPDALAALEACAQAQVAFGVNFHTRHLIWARAARDLIAQGAIGEVTTIHVEAGAGRRPPQGWRADPAQSGLGTVYGQGVHVYDLLRYLLDDDPVEVVAMFDNEKGDQPLETTAMVLMRFRRGTLAYVNCNHANPHPRNDFTLNGTLGRLVAENLSRSRNDGVLRLLTQSGEVVTPYPNPEAHRRCLTAYTESVLSGRDPNASGLDGLRSVELTTAMAQSVAERRVVPVEYWTPPDGFGPGPSGRI